MRVALDARHAVDHFPGIGRYVAGLAGALASLETSHTLVLICAPASPNTRFDLRALARRGVEIVTTDARPFSLAEQRAVPRLLRRARADLYHAPYYVMPYAGLPCPAVVTLYDVIPRLFPGEVPLRARLLFDLLTRLALRAAAKVIAISESGRRDLVGAFRIPPERISVTPLAAGDSFRPPSPGAVGAVRARHGLPRRYVLCVSSNKPHKNLPALIEAWALLRESQATLVIAGRWDPRYPEARLAAGRLGLGERVRFLPNIAEADLAALYGGAEAFVFPSRYEGFGLPPLEAMACGAPVICGAASSLPEVVGDAALTADVRSPAAIAGAIARLLGDPGERERLRAAGRERAAAFSWQRTAALTLNIYQQTSPNAEGRRSAAPLLPPEP